MNIIKLSVRKVLNLIDKDLEYKLIDQYHFNRLKRRPPGLMWKAVAPSPEARLDAGRGQAGHELCVFGGFRWDGTVIRSVDIFDMKKEKWTQRIDLPTNMAQTHLGVASDGERYIYLVSGQLGDYCHPATKDCFVFDVKNRAFSQIPPLPKARYASAVQLWDGRLHSVAGAKEDRNAPGTEHWSIAVKDGKALEKNWREDPPIPRGGHHRASAVVDNALYIFGGQEGDYVAIPGDKDFRCTAKLTTETRFAETFRLKAGAKQWERMADMVVLTSHTEAAVVTLNGIVYVLGGDSDRAAMKSVIKLNDEIQAYDAKADFWKIVGRLPYRVKEAATGYYKGYIYITTGQRDRGPDDPVAARRFERGTWKAKFPPVK
ncbi:MAG: hypothetical protein A2Z88_00590 [Omnitrophica WOR_2 bacterium GWA2_47_8]|nr:MAG: hypothetical protein A2Z88_00590 [Omnitrophica WOR_2 bacterium GWA2_47_8]